MLVVAGIPGPFRPQIWASLARISLHKQNYPMDYYAGLLDRVDSSPVSHLFDAGRTFEPFLFFA